MPWSPASTAQMDKPWSCVARPGPPRILQQSMSNSVADIHPAEARYPSPAARSNHYDAAEATSPIAMAVPGVAPAHSTATLAAAGGNFGRNERRDTNCGEGVTAKIVLRIIDLSWF